MDVCTELLKRLLRGDEEPEPGLAGEAGTVTAHVVERLLGHTDGSLRASYHDLAVQCGLAPLPDDASRHELLVPLATAAGGPKDSGVSGRLPLAIWLAVPASFGWLSVGASRAPGWREAMHLIMESMGRGSGLAHKAVRIMVELRARAAVPEFLEAIDDGDRIPTRGRDAWLAQVVAALLDPLGSDENGVHRAEVALSGPSHQDTVRAWVLRALAPDELGVLDFEGACADRALLRSFARVAWCLDAERRQRLAELLGPALWRRETHAPWHCEELALGALVDFKRVLPLARAWFQCAWEEHSLRHELVQRYGAALTASERASLDELSQAVQPEAPCEPLLRRVLREACDAEDDPPAVDRASTALHTAQEDIARAWSSRAVVVCQGFAPLAMDLGRAAKEVGVTVAELWSALDRCEGEVLFSVDRTWEIDWTQASDHFLRATLGGTTDGALLRPVAAELLTRGAPFVGGGVTFTDRAAIDAVLSATTEDNLQQGLGMLPLYFELGSALLRHWFEVTRPWIGRVPPSAWSNALRFARGTNAKETCRIWGEGAGRVWLVDVLGQCVDNLDSVSSRAAVEALRRLVESAVWLSEGECVLVERVGVALARSARSGHVLEGARLVLADAMALGAKTDGALCKLRQAAWAEELEDDAAEEPPRRRPKFGPSLGGRRWSRLSLPRWRVDDCE